MVVMDIYEYVVLDISHISKHGPKMVYYIKLEKYKFFMNLKLHFNKNISFSLVSHLKYANISLLQKNTCLKLKYKILIKIHITNFALDEATDGQTDTDRRIS